MEVNVSRINWRTKNGYCAFCAEVMSGQNIDNKNIEELYPKIKQYIDYETSRSDIPFVIAMDSSGS